jgi:hypothetical protein
MIAFQVMTSVHGRLISGTLKINKITFEICCSNITIYAVRLSAQLVEHLRYEGAEILRDLEDVYSDADMLNALKTKVSPIEFKRFIRAASKTTILDHVVVPAPFGISSETAISFWSPPPKPPAIMPPSPPMPSIAAKLDEEERKLMEELEALKKSKLSETAVRIQKLKEEKERLESIDKTAHVARKEEERARSAVLEKTKQRKSLIDSKFQLIANYQCIFCIILYC